MEQYFYFIWSLLFLLIWAILFFSRKGSRREHFFISLWFGIAAIGVQKTNIQDWWKPLTITGTPLGIEDFIIGFSIGGVAAVLYEVVRRTKKDGERINVPTKTLDICFLLLPALYLLTFFLFKFGSFYSAVVSYTGCIIYILYVRRELIANSLITGFSLAALGIGIYFLLFTIQPTFIHDFWYLRNNWYSELLLGIPIAEYIWYFLTGAYIGPAYQFLKAKIHN